jgi:pimeloyl-ACP methyl ester carboxylesterase
MPHIDRCFLRLAEGQVHLRSVGGDSGQPPLVMIHAAPGSSFALEPLMQSLAAKGAPWLVAPDTLGCGDSAPAALPDPDIAYYADATARLLDALGIERATLYGKHSGARIACEIGVRHPDRVEQVIVEGIGEYEPHAVPSLLEHYAPEKKPDDFGTHLVWAFHFVRDQVMHFPYYMRDPQHRVHSRTMPDAEALHDAAVDVLKALRTYHVIYRAVFRYPTRQRVALLRRHMTVLEMETEAPLLRQQIQAIARAARDARIVPAGATIDSKAQAILGALSEPGRAQTP